MPKRALPTLRFIEIPSDGGGTPPDGADVGAEQPKSFTQDEVNELVGKARTDERRKVSARYADYDDLKAKAGATATAEERMAALEKELQETRHESLKRRVQAAHGISDEDADLFLTGADEETLTAQAKRLAARDTDRKKNNNIAPSEGANPPSPAEDDRRAFVRRLTGRA